MLIESAKLLDTRTCYLLLHSGGIQLPSKLKSIPVDIASMQDHIKLKIVLTSWQFRRLDK